MNAGPAKTREQGSSGVVAVTDPPMDINHLKTIVDVTCDGINAESTRPIGSSGENTL